MVDEVYAFSLTVPAGTVIAAPYIVPLTMPPRYLRRIEVDFPPGPAGNVGVQIAAAGTSQIPINRDAWLIADDRMIGTDYETPISSNAWQFNGYNTGIFDHTIQVRMYVDVPALSQPSPALQPLSF